MKRQFLVSFLTLLFLFNTKIQVLAQGPPCSTPTLEGEINPCLNTSSPYVYKANVAMGPGNSVVWSIPEGGYTLVSVPGTTLIKQITWTTAGTKTITVNRSGCSSSYAKTVVVNVGGPAVASSSNITGNVGPCLNVPSVYSVDSQPGATFIWKILKNGIIDTSNPITINAATNTATITWTSGIYYRIEVYATNGNCISQPKYLDITPGPPPTPYVSSDIGSITKACTGTTVTYTAFTGLNDTYTWSLMPGAGTISSTGNTAIVTWSSTPGNYSLTVSGTNSCGTTSLVLPIDVPNLPVKPIISTPVGPACIGTNFGPVSITNYQAGFDYWFQGTTSGVNGFSTTSDPAKFNFHSNTAGTFQFTTTALNGPCTSQPSEPFSISVINPNVGPAVTGNTQACINTQQTYSISSPTNTYTWSVPAGICLLNGTTSTTATGNSVLITWLQSGVHQLNVRPNSNPCNNTLTGTNYQVTVQSPIVAASVSEIMGSNDVCLKDQTPPGGIPIIAPATFPYTVVYNNNTSISDESNLNINWSVNGGGVIYAVRHLSAFVTWNTAGTYTLTANVSNSCGAGTIKTLTVNSAPAAFVPPAGITGNTTVCPGTPYSFVASPPSSNYVWNTSGKILSSTSSSASAVWKVISPLSHYISYGTNNGVCDNEPFIKNITVSKTSQNISFSSVVPLSQAYGANAPLQATASSGLPVTFSSSNQSIATISVNSVNFVGIGTVDILAHQMGDPCYNPANVVFIKYTVYPSPQTITFNALPAKTYGDAPFALSATASSGLPISYTSSNTAVATVSGNTVTIVGVGSTTITASQAGNTNYNAATSVEQTLNVSKADQTISFGALPSKTYGNSPFTLSANATSGLPISYTSSNTAVATISGNTVTIVGVGSTTITASQAGNANYNAATSVPQPFTVNKATLQAAAGNKSRTYGATNPSFTITYTGFVNGETAAVIDTPPTASTTATLTSNVGNYPITPSGGLDNNYTFTYANGTLSVNKATLLATANNKSRTYGAANPAFTITYTGFMNGETAAVIDTPPTASTTATLTSNVGNYPITLSGGLDNNYTFTYAGGTFTLNKATLLATAVNKSRTYGATNPPFTITYTGFMNGETAAVIDTPPAASTTATLTSNVGNYPITLSGGLDNNYTFTYAGGTLTVNKATLLATAVNKSRTYGSTNPPFTITYTGFVNGETLSVIDAQPTASTAATQCSNVGNYSIAPSGGSDNNYIFTYGPGILTIGKASLSVYPLNQAKCYGAQNPVLTLTYLGFKCSDNSSVIDSSPLATTSATQFSSPGNYTINSSGGSDNNYSFIYYTGTLTIESQNGSITQSGELCIDGVVTLTAGGGVGYEWYQDGYLIYNQNSRQLTVYNAGTYTVNYFTISGCPVSASIYVSNTPPPGNPETPCQALRKKQPDDKTEIPIEEIKGSGAYPNPANNEVTVQLPLPAESKLEVKMMSQFGSEVTTSEIKKGELKTSIDTKSFADGVYIIFIKSIKGTVIHHKVIIRH